MIKLMFIARFCATIRSENNSNDIDQIRHGAFFFLQCEGSRGKKSFNAGVTSTTTPYSVLYTGRHVACILHLTLYAFASFAFIYYARERERGNTHS